MFRLRSLDEPCEWPVRVQIPQAGGKTTTATFTAEFRLLDTERTAQLVTEGDVAFVGEFLVGWKGVEDEDGSELAFSPERRDALARIPYVKRAIFEAYNEFASGRRAKN